MTKTNRISPTLPPLSLLPHRKRREWHVSVFASRANPILFAYTGKAFDTSTALQNNINRWYDATMGRWLNPDPIGFEGSDANLYRYVGNAVHYTDFSGLRKCGPRVWVYTGSWCVEDNVWEAAIEAAEQSIPDARTVLKPNGFIASATSIS
ncbi:MAG: RHS repeat-associated core domain-containing protein [Planctomycetia bacterium]|nr:RHS repeat-associated core domain-containing protein [Planctomycetia bacterium]